MHQQCNTLELWLQHAEGVIVLLGHNTHYDTIKLGFTTMLLHNTMLGTASCYVYAITFFSMEHMAKHQPCSRARFTSRASIHSDLPELGTPVMMVSSPGTT